MIEHALALARLELRVFPCFGWQAEKGLCGCGLPPGKDDKTECGSAAKHPIIKAWQDEASTDEAKVRAWWGRWPNANIGVATGAGSGVAVIDVDMKPGYVGGETLAALEAIHGQMPATAMVLTPSGGHHYYYKHPGGKGSSVNNFYKHIDYKTDGGYVIGPGSVYKNGQRYVWDLCSEMGVVPLAAVPQWHLDEVARRAEDRATAVSAPMEYGADGKVTKGSRRPKAISLLGTLLRRDVGMPTMEAALRAFNADKCDPLLTEAEIQKLLNGASKYPPADSDHEIHNTDMGNAMRLVKRHGEEFRYCPQLGWLVWDGSRWVGDEFGAIMELAKDTVQWMHVDAVKLDKHQARELGKWAFQSESSGHLEAMICLAKTVPGVVQSIDSFDVDDMLLNCPNGTLDLKTGLLRDHRPEDMITKMTNTPYVAGADTSVVDAFMDKIMQKNVFMKTYLQRALGYALTGDTSAQAFYLAYGCGANGKSTLLNAVQHAMGDYAKTCRVEVFVSGNADKNILNDLAALKGARFVLTTEPEAGKKLAESLVKSVTGGEMVSTRFHYKEFFEYLPKFKLWLGTNHMPPINGTEEGIWRRVKLIPFSYRIPDNERDEAFRERFKVEHSEALLAWLVKGCLDWQADGFCEPAEVKDATKSYRVDMDKVQPFIDECCVCAEGQWMYQQDAYKVYKGRALDNGERPMKSKNFYLALSEKGFLNDKAQRRERGYYFQGIGLVVAVSSYSERSEWLP